MKLDQMQCFQRCACERVLFKPSLQALLTGGGKSETLLEILGIPLLSAQHKQIHISQLLNQAVLSG